MLLIHGDDDRNVPFNQTIDLVQRLRKQNVQFEELIFPDEIHDFLLWKSWIRAIVPRRSSSVKNWVAINRMGARLSYLNDDLERRDVAWLCLLMAIFSHSPWLPMHKRLADSEPFVIQAATLAIIKGWLMAQIDLNTGSAARIAVGHYNGVDAPLTYGDTASELAALRSGAGVFQLGWRGLITAGGKDRTRWLHNMTTNNVRDLAPNRGVYAFVLNAQGRILGDMTIYNLGESLLLETDRSQIEPLLTSMKRYIIMDKVELADARELFSAIGACGPKSAEVLSKAGFDVNGMEPLEIREQNAGGVQCRIIRGASRSPDGMSSGRALRMQSVFSTSFTRPGRSPLGQKRWSSGVSSMASRNTDRTFAIAICRRKPARCRRLASPRDAISARKLWNAYAHAARCIVNLPALILVTHLVPPGKFEADGRTLAEVTSSLHINWTAAERTLGWDMSGMKLCRVRELWNWAGRAYESSTCHLNLSH